MMCHVKTAKESAVTMTYFSRFSTAICQRKKKQKAIKEPISEADTK